MKKILSFFSAAALLALGACSPDEVEYVNPDVNADDLVEGVAFAVTHDAENPNIIHLTSLMPTDYQVAWEHPQGRSTETTCDLNIAFAGDYEVKFGVNTAGGYVWSKPYVFHIDDMCADFIADPMWTMVAGGAGQSKTWVLDINANGETRSRFAGPIWFFNANFTWDKLHTAAGGNYIDDDPWEAANAIDPTPAAAFDDGTAEGWYWAADYAGNSWMCAADDYGTFTFDLNGGANITTENHFEGTTTGKYMLDTENHTMKLTDLSFYPIDGRIAGVKDWRIIYLTEDFMQLMSDVPGASTGICLNFVSKEWYDNWSPTVEVEGLPEGWYNTFVNQNLYGTWALDVEMPFDYFTLENTRMNVNGEYPSKEAALALAFNTPDMGLYKANDAADNEYAGDYTVSTDGVLTFANGLGSSLIAGVDVYLSTDVHNQLQILSLDYDDLGRISGMWIGKTQYDYNGQPFRKIGYHYNAVFGSGGGKTYKATLNSNNTANWTMYTGPAVYVTEGTFTVTVGDSQNNFTLDEGQPLLWLDVNSLLKDHPNCDVVINKIVSDGKEIPFVDSDISRGAGDEPSVARRYIYNAWGPAACFTDPSVFCYSTGIEVTFTIVYENGTPFVPEEE